MGPCTDGVPTNRSVAAGCSKIIIPCQDHSETTNRTLIPIPQGKVWLATRQCIYLTQSSQFLWKPIQIETSKCLRLLGCMSSRAYNINIKSPLHHEGKSTIDSSPIHLSLQQYTACVGLALRPKYVTASCTPGQILSRKLVPCFRSSDDGPAYWKTRELAHYLCLNWDSFSPITVSWRHDYWRSASRALDQAPPKWEPKFDS